MARLRLSVALLIAVAHAVVSTGARLPDAGHEADHAPGIPRLQRQAAAPDFFTSPPTQEAKAAAEPCGEACVSVARAYAAKGLCSLPEAAGCQMVFLPQSETFPAAKTGVIFYPGALVDPRAYAPLARELADGYSLPTVVPIFAEDLANDCDGSRAELAARAVPGVRFWVMAGHSLGGDVAAQALRAWLSSSRTDAKRSIGGLALLGSYLNTEPSCGRPPLDLSRMPLSAAIVEATNDHIVNRSRLAAGAHLLPPAEYVFQMNVTGGNHSQFGSYDPSNRPGPLGPDGNATIPEAVQRGLSAAAIADVAARGSHQQRVGGGAGRGDDLKRIASRATEAFT